VRDSHLRAPARSRGSAGLPARMEKARIRATTATVSTTVSRPRPSTPLRAPRPGTILPPAWTSLQDATRIEAELGFATRSCSPVSQVHGLATASSQDFAVLSRARST
jgi:hypothetical protein